MKTLDVRNASKSLADYTAELDSESIVITSNEKPVAALISLRGLDRESVALSLSPDFAKIIRVARFRSEERKRILAGRGQNRLGRGNCFYQIKDSCRARPQTKEEPQHLTPRQNPRLNSIPGVTATNGRALILLTRRDVRAVCGRS